MINEIESREKFLSIVILILVLIIVALAINDSRKQEITPEPLPFVYNVRDHVITVEDFDKKVERLKMQEMYDTMAELREIARQEELRRQFAQ